MYVPTLHGRPIASHTGIVFALELTRDWGIVLPLLVAVPVAYAFTVLILRRSILTEKVSRRGFHLSREYATEPLEILFVLEVMRTNVVVLPAALTRAELLASLDGEQQIRPLFYVVDAAKKLVGVVTRSDLESWMIGRPTESWRPPSWRPADSGKSLDAPVPSTLGEVARRAVVADADEPIRAALSRMAQSGRTWLPVVAHGDPREIFGELTLEDTLKARVKHLEEEERRERVLPLEAILPKWLNVAAGGMPAIFRAKTASQTEPERPD